MISFHYYYYLFIFDHGQKIIKNFKWWRLVVWFYCINQRTTTKHSIFDFCVITPDINETSCWSKFFNLAKCKQKISTLIKNSLNLKVSCFKIKQSSKLIVYICRRVWINIYSKFDIINYKHCLINSIIITSEFLLCLQINPPLRQIYLASNNKKYKQMHEHKLRTTSFIHIRSISSTLNHSWECKNDNI